MKKIAIYHPILIALFPVIFLYAANQNEMKVSQIFWPLVLSLAGVSILYLAISFFLKDRIKAAIVTSIWIIFFFSYGHFYDLITDWGLEPLLFGRRKFLILLWGLIPLSFFIWGLRSKKKWDGFNQFLNIFAFCLVLLGLWNIGVYQKQTGQWLKDGQSWWRSRHQIRNKVAVNPNDPDIYYIILDGYASSATLRDVFNYNNDDFINHLRSRGFYVADRSHSNYVLTYLSLGSSLNLEYINYLSQVKLASGQKISEPAYKLIADNKVIKFLKSRGYKYINFGSGFGITDFNSNADINYINNAGNEFQMMLFQTTLLRIFDKYFSIKDVARQRILKVFSQLTRVPKISGPKFVFAHIMIPHWPYLFGPDGERITQPISTNWPRKYYLNQLIYTNKKVKIMLDGILANSPKPPVIILQSDHGPMATFDINMKGPPTLTNIKERCGILNAYYLPPKGDPALSLSITPVNTFRLIFKHYFNQNYALLPNRVYFSSYKDSYKFDDISAQLGY